jgi:hypothetical protein
MTETSKAEPETEKTPPKADAKDKPAAPAREIGGRKGPEPTRYGDWEKNGIISDF